MDTKNNRKMGMAASVIVILMGMAALGLFVPGQANGDAVWDGHLVSSASVDPTWVYSTSTVDVNISYSLAPEDMNLELSNLTITVVEVSSGVLPMPIYNWNRTGDGGMPDNPYTWSLDGSQGIGDWIINVTADYHNSTLGDDHYGSEEIHFQVIDGTHIIQEISAEPKIVKNNGMDMVNMSFMFNRNFDEMDMDRTEAMFFHVDTMSWVDDEVLMIPEPAPENITDGLHNSSAWSHMTIPEDLPVGEYKFYFNFFDRWGYNESINETVFEVIWKELPPVMANDTVYMHEDGFEIVDLDDHFEDVNGQDLMYYINMSQFENLMITWEDEADNHINVSAAENYFGTETFDLNVTDGIDMPGHNVTFTMTVNVMPVEDPLMPAEDLTIEVNEVSKEALFNPQDLFYDPDGPAEFTVSLGTEMVNVSGNMTEMPAWTWTDGNFSIAINETDNTVGTAIILEDMEEGMANFPIYAWMNGSVVLMEEATVMVQEVNDVPMPLNDTITMFKNEPFTGNLSELFMDPDSEMLNFTVNDTMAENVAVEYDWMTHTLTITPILNWTGTTTFMVNATDGIDYQEYTMNVEVILRSYEVSGTVTFEEVAGVDVNLSNVTMMIGETEVVLADDGTFSVMIEEGDYEVTLDIPDELTYSEADERSGYEIPVLDPINLTADETYDVSVSYMEYNASSGEATWDDLDFENVEFDDDDDLMVMLPVMEGTENYTGWDTFVVKLVIRESDDEELNFTMTWDDDNDRFTVTLTDDDLEDLGDGKKEYYFMNEDGTQTSEEEKYEFKSEDENAGPMTIIILVALILLVLVALIFIMRKPSEEDFDEEEDEEEEEGRTCPGCGETITDDEAEECPYCGEDLEEE